ncbi:MAG: HEAT repeat domain-containing protein [Sandaracinaceae bacterium]
MPLFPQLRPTFEAALRDVTSKDVRMRTAAAKALGSNVEGREDQAKRALRSLLDDPSGDVRTAAIESLGRLRDRDALDTILARFDDGDPVVRQIAILAAGDIGDRRALQPLLRLLRHDAPDVRFQAVAALAALSREEVEPDEILDRFGELVTDDDPLVRENLADALGALEVKEAEPSLERLLGDEHMGVRRAAAIGLARTKNPAGIDELVKALSDRDRLFEAAWALGEIADPRAAEPLARLAKAFFSPLLAKAAAGMALAKIGDPRGIEALRGALTALRADARSYAAEVAGDLGLVELRPELEALSRRPRGADPEVVAAALAKLGGD